MRRRHAMRRRFWTSEEDAMLRAFYPDTRTDDLARELRRSATSVYARARLLGLDKTDAYMASPAACRLRRGDHVGKAYEYAKGHVPANKGLRRPGYAPGRMAETQFKPGVATRWMPIGSTRLVDGYLYRKVTDVRKVSWTRNWRQEHYLVWEAAHGPIPPGYAIAFKNGNRRDVQLGNLERITRQQLMARNTVQNLPPALRKTVQLLGALQRQINQRTTHAERH